MHNVAHVIPLHEEAWFTTISRKEGEEKKERKGVQVMETRAAINQSINDEGYAAAEPTKLNKLDAFAFWLGPEAVRAASRITWSSRIYGGVPARGAARRGVRRRPSARLFLTSL